jgi:hypothetical protein
LRPRAWANATRLNYAMLRCGRSRSRCALPVRKLRLASDAQRAYEGANAGACMPNDAIRRQAERLLTLALQERQRGSSELADELVARAMQLFDEANGLVEDPGKHRLCRRPRPQLPSHSNSNSSASGAKRAERKNRSSRSIVLLRGAFADCWPPACRAPLRVSASALGTIEASGC